MNLFIFGDDKNLSKFKEIVTDIELTMTQVVYYNIESSNFSPILTHADYSVILVDAPLLESKWFYYLMGYYQDKNLSLSLFSFEETFQKIPQYVKELLKEPISNPKILKIKILGALNNLKLREQKYQARKRLRDADFFINFPEMVECIEKGNLSHLCDFVDVGYSPSSENKRGVSLVAISIRHRHFAIFNFLIERGANVHVISQDRGYNLLMEAVSIGSTEMLEKIIDFDADVNQLSKNNQTALILAVGQDSYEICKLLLKRGADPLIEDSLGMNAKDYADTFASKEIQKLLEKF